MEHQAQVEAPVVMVLHQEAQDLVAQDMEHPVVDQVQVVVDMVEPQVVRTVSKCQDRTAKVFLYKFQGSKEQGNREQSVKFPTLVEVGAVTTMQVQGVVY